MIYNCRTFEDKRNKNKEEEYINKFRKICRVCSKRLEGELKFHPIKKEITSRSDVLLLCKKCHDKFCNDLILNKMFDIERKLTNKIKEFSTISKDMYISKLHGNNMQKTGLPDYIGHINGDYVALELKAYSNGPTKIQSHEIREINKTGGKAISCYSVDQLITVYEDLRSDHN